MKTPRFIGWLLLVALLALVVACRCWTWGAVFAGGETFFLDPDCYSRMTRVQQIVEEPGKIIGRHDFENWPDGVLPHTTAPMDYLLAAAAWLLGVFVEKARALSLAGAWTPVALGLATALFLWRWAGNAAERGERWRGGEPSTRWLVLGFFAISPMLVQATALGRPDHQALVVPLLAVALAAEGALLAGWGSRRNWSLVAGGAWGLALWVSLYEPGVFFTASLLLVAVLDGRSLISPERLAGWGVMLGVIAVALLVDGWRSPLPDAEILKAFPYWAATIGELQSVPPWSQAIFRWTSALWFLAFFLLPWVAYRHRDQAKPALFFLALLLLALALTCWQVRWGYFLSLVYLLSLPWQLLALPKEPVRRRGALVIAVIALVPVFREWTERFDPKGEGARSRLIQRQENVALRDLAYRIAAQPEPGSGAILAPWWQSPALAYWTRLPCVAGSSHQSLPGTLDTARFYLSTDPAEALTLAHARKVTFVVVYEPQFVLANSMAILGLSLPPEEGAALGERLFRRPNSPPPGFRLVGGNGFFRLFRIDEPALSRIPWDALIK